MSTSIESSQRGYTIKYVYKLPPSRPWTQWSPDNGPWQPIDPSIPPNYEVSEKLCHAFSNGFTCKRLRQEGGCPDVHDPDLRKGALIKIRERKEAEQLKKMVADEKKKMELQREEMQKEYDESKITSFAVANAVLKALVNNNISENICNKPGSRASKTNVDKNTSTKSANVNTASAKTNVIKNTAKEPANTNTASLKNNANKPASKKPADRINTDSSKTQVNVTNAGPKSVVVAQTARGPPLPCKVLTIIKDDPNQFLGANTFCQQYLKRWGCKKKENCPRVHDAALRKAYMEDFKLKKASTANKGRDSNVVSDTGSNFPAAWDHPTNNFTSKKTSKKVTSKTTTKENVAIKTPAGDSKAATKYSRAAKANVIYPSAPERPVVQKAWNQDELALWAFNNLKKTTLTKLLVPHLKAGKIPTKFLTLNHQQISSEIFHYFPLLPGEIRNQIWNDVLDGDIINCFIHFGYEYEHEGNYYGTKIIPGACIPRLFHVSSEARSLAQTRYETTFATVNNPPTTPFNYAQDKLTILTSNSRELLPITKSMVARDLHRISWLGLPLRDYLFNRQEFCIAITKFKRLQILQLMVGDSKEDLMFSDDKRLEGKAKKTLEVTWKKVRPNRPMPQVKINVIGALLARNWKIDGLKWH